MSKYNYKKLITPLYVINVVVQAIITLASAMGIAFFIAYLLNKHAGVGTWIYVVFIMIGVISGFYSMIVFILRACRAIEGIERQTKSEKEHRNGEK